MKNQAFFKLFTFVTLSALFLSSCSVKNDNKCIIRGTVVDRDSDTLLLLKATKSFRMAEIGIPIVDNHFKYELDVKDIEAYQLIFLDELQQGAWHTIIFFAEPGTVDFTLYPKDEYEKNIINGGAITQEYYKIEKLEKEHFSPKLDPLYKETQALLDSGEYWSEKANILYDKISATVSMDSLNIIYKELGKIQETKEDLSPKARIVVGKIEAVNDERAEWKYNYIVENPSIATYYLLMQDVLYNDRSKTVEGLIVKTFPVFEDKFPGHPYTTIARDMIDGMESAKVGGKYIDFTAPDLKGNKVKISTIIDNHKATFLDLWASWCGPCIAKSKAMIPVYEEYKDKGFTVIGVAREKKNTEKMKQAIERYKFPWLNLVDLNDENSIWKKYDIPFSGGGTFLIDEEGKIIAIDPGPDEVRKYLDKILE